MTFIILMDKTNQYCKTSTIPVLIYMKGCKTMTSRSNPAHGFFCTVLEARGWLGLCVFFAFLSVRRRGGEKGGWGIETGRKEETGGKGSIVGLTKYKIFTICPLTEKIYNNIYNL